MHRGNYTVPLDVIDTTTLLTLDAEGMRAVIIEALESAGHGAQTRLAKALDVSPSTVNKWVKGQVRPEIDRWPAIEEALSLEPGTLRRAAGLTQPGEADAIAQLQAKVESLMSEIAGLRARLDALPLPPDEPDVAPPSAPGRPDG